MMSQTKLQDELANLIPVATEAEAAINLTEAYAAFAADASAATEQITPTGVALGKAAMVPALAGMNAPGAGASVIQSALQAFWGAVALGLATSIPGATAITPPPHAALAASLSSVFASNTSSNATKDSAIASIASVLYANAIAGGTVTFPGPVVFPIL